MIDYALVPDHAQTAAALREVDAHLDGFPADARSAAFERLSAQGVASLLHLPFYDESTDPGGAGPRVTWRGQGSMCSPHGPDGLAVALGCWIVIEATRKTGTKQWTQEFGPCVDHVAQVASSSGAEARDVWAVLLATKLHLYTFSHAKAWNQANASKLILLEPELLASAVETAGLAFTLTHVEVRALFAGLVECLQDAPDVAKYRTRSRDAVRGWQRRVLDAECRVVVAVASYRAMLTLAHGGAKVTGVGEIYGALLKNQALCRYFELADADIDLGFIAESLKSERLGYRLQTDPVSNEEIFCPMPLADFRSRSSRRLRAVEAAHAAP